MPKLVENDHVHIFQVHGLRKNMRPGLFPKSLDPVENRHVADADQSADAPKAAALLIKAQSLQFFLEGIAALA